MFMPSDSHQIDVRGPRFGAAVTTVVLVAALASGNVWVIGAQTLVFAIGAVAGLRYAPYGRIFARLVRPRLGPPGEFEDDRPPRFAQVVGLVFAAVGTIGYASGATALGMVATALALVAAFLNAAFALCLGCEMYLLLRRWFPGRRPAAL
jgi:hypothetical protein